MSLPTTVCFWALNTVVTLLSIQGQKALRFHQKYLNLCSKEEWRSHRFGTTWWRVINDRIFIFGWTILLSTLTVGLMLLLLLWFQRRHDPDSRAVSVCSSCTQPVWKTASGDLRRVKPPWAYNIHTTPHRAVDLHPNTWARDWPSVSSLMSSNPTEVLGADPILDFSWVQSPIPNPHQSVIKYTLSNFFYHNSNIKRSVMSYTSTAHIIMLSRPSVLKRDNVWMREHFIHSGMNTITSRHQGLHLWCKLTLGLGTSSISEPTNTAIFLLLLRHFYRIYNSVLRWDLL